MGSRNRFVCLQLVTMVREQVARNAAARAAGDAAGLAEGGLVFLATVAAEAGERAGRVVGAALFYPRLPKPPVGGAGAACERPPQLSRTVSLTVRAGPAAGDGAPEGAAPAAAAAIEQQVSPTASSKAAAAAAAAAGGAHVYVELICVNTPGCGYGGRLLRHIESFAARNAGALERAHPRYGRLAGLRLLSVGSAQAFYSRLGYGEPDAQHEMFKPFSALAL